MAACNNMRGLYIPRIWQFWYRKWNSHFSIQNLVSTIIVWLYGKTTRETTLRPLWCWASKLLFRSKCLPVCCLGSLQFSFPPSSWASITPHLSFEGLLPCLSHPHYHGLASKPPNLPGLPFLPAVEDKARSFCFFKVLTANDFWENPKATRALVLWNGKKVLAISLPFMLTVVRLCK